MSGVLTGITGWPPSERQRDCLVIVARIGPGHPARSAVPEHAVPRRLGVRLVGGEPSERRPSPGAGAHQQHQHRADPVGLAAVPADRVFVRGASDLDLAPGGWKPVRALPDAQGSGGPAGRRAPGNGDARRLSHLCPAQRHLHERCAVRQPHHPRKLRDGSGHKAAERAVAHHGNGTCVGGGGGAHGGGCHAGRDVPDARARR